MTVEVREFGYDDMLVIFTDSESVRKELKKLKCFEHESGYFGSHNDLQAVDIYLSQARMSQAQRQKFRQQIKAQKNITT
jgi:hypothetical protein